MRPLVQVGGIPVDAERRDVKRQRPGRVRAVDEHRHAASVTGRSNRGHRHHERSLRGDVIDDDELRLAA